MMEFIYNDIFLKHNTGLHPENSKRLDYFRNLPQTILPDGEKYLNLIHPQPYVEKIKLACSQVTNLDRDTVVGPGSWESAVAAVGASVLASQTGGFSLGRPPGHHAHKEKSGGFCLFNNIAIATQNLVNQGKKVFILDIDGHLGDGTEEIFYDTDRVLYWSMHQYPAYPGGGNLENIGVGKGLGYTINVPLSPGTGDEIYLSALKSLIPVPLQFRPDVVAVSAGFDAHQHDGLLNLKLSANVFWEIGNLLRENFSSIFAVLEGGYNLYTFTNCVLNFQAGINGDEIKYNEEALEPNFLLYEEYEERLESLKQALSPYWKLK